MRVRADRSGARQAPGRGGRQPAGPDRVSRVSRDGLIAPIGPLRIVGRVQDAFPAQLEALPAATRLLLLLAAADGACELNVILRAGVALGVSPVDLGPAERGPSRRHLGRRDQVPSSADPLGRVSERPSSSAHRRARSPGRCAVARGRLRPPHLASGRRGHRPRRRGRRRAGAHRRARPISRWGGGGRPGVRAGRAAQHQPGRARRSWMVRAARSARRRQPPGMGRPGRRPRPPR